MDTKAIREQTRDQVLALGYAFNPNLPILDRFELTRTPADFQNRTLILNTCVACSYGFAGSEALRWLEREGLSDQLTDAESLFLHGRASTKQSAYQWQVEALWALVWAGGFFPALDFGQTCSNALVKMFPDLKVGETSDAFRQAYVIRSVSEIASMLDLAYCLHWAIRQQQLQGAHPQRNDKRIPGQVIIERRRALEWLASDQDWDDVLLDT